MNEELKNGIIVTVTVLLIIVIVYFTTAIFMTGEIGKKSSKENKTTTTTNSANSEYENSIIASFTFKQSKDEYMVMFFSKKDSKEQIKNALKSYNSADDKLKLYVVNVDEAINKYVKDKEFNPNATSSDELKINKDTLLVIKNGVIDSYVTDEDEIVSKLN